MKGKIYELKIESDISGTSIYLFTERRLIDRWTSDNPLYKSDYLLESVSVLLVRNEIEIGEIGKISIKKNSRSLTGYKIAVSALKGISFIHGTEIIYED